MSSNVTKAELTRCYERLIGANLEVQTLRDQCVEDLNQKLTIIETQIKNIWTANIQKRIVEMQKKQSVLEEKARGVSKVWTTLEEIIPSIKQKIGRLERATDDFVQSGFVERLALEIYHLEKANREKDRLLLSLKTGFLMPKMEEPREGELLWSIYNTILRIHEAKTGKVPYLDSPEFRTGNTGYRMKLRLYLYGNGAGKGSHLSLFLIIMNGSYNRLLDWPFQQKVTFSLLCPDNPSLTITDSFMPDPQGPSFAFTEDENPGFGFPQFAPISVLEGDTFIQRYTLFLKCVVDKNHYMPDTRKDAAHFQ